MPTYDLVCAGCEHRFEAFRQGFLRDEDRECPQCGAQEARQLFTGFVTARPSRGPVATGGGGGCGCGP